MTGYVIIFNRDQLPVNWKVVGPFDSKEIAGEYAKQVYRENKWKWVVMPILDKMLYA